MNKFVSMAASAFVLTATAVPVNAVSLNQKGLGQVLIYPYYTVNKGQDTYLSVTNGSDVGKAVRVRFMEGYNGREVSSFNLYLSAHDIWTAAVASIGDATTGAQMITHDHSCLDGASATRPFSASAYNGDLAVAALPRDGGPQDIARTREGHFEIIAMGDVVPGSSLDADITHSDGAPGTEVPANCAAAPGDAAGLIAPTGGLFGTGAVINVAEGTYFAYNADAISGFTDTVLYANPGSAHPTLQDANSSESLQTARAYLSTDSGKPLTVDYTNGRNAVSAVFMANALYNEFLIDAGLGANTDWVIIFPTKRFHVDQGAYPGNSIAPFESAFAQGRSNTYVEYAEYDREAATTEAINCIEPPLINSPCPGIALPYEVNVLGFQATAIGAGPSAVLGSTLNVIDSPTGGSAYGEGGWMKLDLTANIAHQLFNGVTTPGGGVTLNGLPATGFMVYNIINSSAQPGRLANYGGLFPHRTSLSCASAAPPGTVEDPCS